MKKVAIFTYYDQSFGRDILQGILDFKFHHASELWEICRLSEGDIQDLDYIRNGDFDCIFAKIQNEEVAKILTERKKLGVNLSEVSAKTDIPTVTFDNYRIGQLAAEHLLNLKLNEYVAICRPWFTAMKRWEGFSDTLKKSGKKPIPINTETPVFKAQNRDDPEKLIEKYNISLQGLEEVINELEPPIGFFTINDALGLGVLDVARKLKKKVPDEISVIGVNDDPVLCRISRPELTSIAINGYQVGFRAAKTMESLITGKEIEDYHIGIQPEKISTRHSTDILDIDDELVCDALRYIRAHINEPLNATDIVNKTPASRRSLEYRFKDSLNKGIYRTILDSKIGEAKRLLETTMFPIDKISTETGFSSIQTFYKSFKNLTGATPNEYRKMVS